MSDVAIEILSDHRCHLGEGPSYDGRTNTAWWFDIVECKLFEARLGDGSVQAHDLPFMGSVLAPIDDKRQLIASSDGLFVRDRASGRLDLLTHLESDNSVTRSNDGRVHPAGALWIGTMGRSAEQGAGSIYWFRDGELRRLFSDISIPNGICFSPDGRTGYFTDSRVNLFHRVPLDPDTGLPIGQPSVLYDHRGGEGGLDGAVVDSEGLIWNARWGASAVDVYTPEGDRVRTIRVPATRPSCPSFIGPDLDRLLVTTAWEGMSEDEKKADPNAGMTLVLDVHARGIPEPSVRISA
ncbi:SMP-30/gluconolactonase/LRE family protein [Aureimonas ureilytica]|uniref:SMP-30/gluconolactonase/LRE family protein n=1 Tax=Aureimonas ureilytica TaxID=401562 RepID=UPI00037D2C9A|nr:SMP-30/gluconolactonase/LRE family protein [Aureimonas ureilytica]